MNHSDLWDSLGRHLSLLMLIDYRRYKDDKIAYHVVEYPPKMFFIWKYLSDLHQRITCVNPKAIIHQPGLAGRLLPTQLHNVQLADDGEYVVLAKTNQDICMEGHAPLLSLVP